MFASLKYVSMTLHLNKCVSSASHRQKGWCGCCPCVQESLCVFSSSVLDGTGVDVTVSLALTPVYDAVVMTRGVCVCVHPAGQLVRKNLCAGPQG